MKAGTRGRAGGRGSFGSRSTCVCDEGGVGSGGA